MQTYRARHVLRADRRGSSWPVLVDTEAGVFFTKLRGAAQAPASLVAEIIVGALADALGLSVPARVLIEIPADVSSDDRHEELIHLLRGSAGRNLGFEYLSGAKEFQRADVERVDSHLASAIVWLDGLVLNPDRTAKNPNLLWAHDQLWLIDHGASLGFQHDWSAVTEQSPRVPGRPINQHVLGPRATRLALVDDHCASLLDRKTLEGAAASVPDEYLSPAGGEHPSRVRTAYVAFLWKRLKPPRPFLSVRAGATAG